MVTLIHLTNTSANNIPNGKPDVNSDIKMAKEHY